MKRSRRAIALATLRVTALVVAVMSVVTAVLILVACFVDDHRIDADMGSATATVTDVSPRRAAIEFDTAEGTHARPSTGVFYPTGLVKGQRVQVEYRRANPALVRVSGRSWTVAVWPALSVPVFALPVCALLYAAGSPAVHRRAPRIRRGFRR